MSLPRRKRAHEIVARASSPGSSAHVVSASAVDQVVGELDAHHHGMVGVADLVSPGAEPAPRVDVVRHQPRLDDGQGPVATDRRHRVRVRDLQELLAHDLVGRLLGGEQLARHHALDRSLDRRRPRSPCLYGDADTSASNEKWSGPRRHLG